MKLLALVESPDHVCCRYRVRAFAPALQQAGWSLTCEGLDEVPWLRALQLRRASQFDARDPAAQAVAGLAAPHPPPSMRGTWSSTSTTRCKFRDSYDPRGQDEPSPSPTVRRRLCALADTIVAGNDFLADCALRAGAQVERRPRDPDLRGPRRLPDGAARALGGPLDLVWIGSASTLRAWNNRVAIWERLADAVPETQAPRDLRPIPGLIPDSRRCRCPGRADRGPRDRGRPDRRELAARRPLEPRQVRTEGPPVPGGRPAGRRQPGRLPLRDDPRRARRHPGDRPGRVGRGRPAARRRPRAAAADGIGCPASRRGRLLGLGLVRDVRPLDDRREAARGHRHRELESRPARADGRGPTGLRAARRPGPNHFAVSTRLATDEPLHAHTIGLSPTAPSPRPGDPGNAASPDALPRGCSSRPSGSGRGSARSAGGSARARLARRPAGPGGAPARRVAGDRDASRP